MLHKIAVVTFLALGLVCVQGCGSGSGTLKAAPTITGVVTRANAARFSSDARLLAARESTDGWISASVASQIDTDLSAIRAHTPAVADIHVLPDFAPDTILIEVAKSAPWYGNWAAGTVTTGVAAVDSLSTAYRASAVSTVAVYETSAVFKLTFADLLATKYVAVAYRTADAGIQSARVDYTVGDGNSIDRQVSGGTRLYSLSKGWGDCAAGCINHHDWNFTIAADGSISVSETGPSLPTL